MPRYVLKKTTKNTVKKLSAIFDAIPSPKSGRRIGATAILGSELSETSTGSTTSEVPRRYARPRPSAAPPMMPSTSPTIASVRVVERSCQSRPDCA